MVGRPRLTSASRDPVIAFGTTPTRARTSGRVTPELEIFTGRTIDQPSTFISGKSDWGNYQSPGALEKMQKSACTNMKEIHMVEGAGHWVQQEQAAEVSRLLIKFLKETRA